MITLSDSNETTLQEKFLEQFLLVLSALEKEEKICIWLSWGSSFDIFYRELSGNFHRVPQHIAKKIYFAFLDERIVPLSHPDRNEDQLRKKFLTQLLADWFIREEQILSVDIGANDIVLSYSQKVPHIHIGLLGVGPDGHIASLFPHHRLLRSESDSYLEITDSPKPPSHRITVSPRIIQCMDYRFLSVMKGKEEILDEFLDDTLSIKSLPVFLLGKSDTTILMTNIPKV